MTGPIRPGAFSVSLSVADLAASQAFYETIGFEVTGGDADQGWLILRNGSTLIGLFHGMFEGTLLTFNPGLGQDGEPDADGWTDVREIQVALRAAGVEPIEATDPDRAGPAHIVVEDPDGNRIMFDQFGDRP